MPSAAGAEDLFGQALQERLARQAPLAARLRPRTLDEMVGQQHLLGREKPLRTLIEADRLSSVILWGPPGTGKTTLARLIAQTTDKEFETLSAVSAGVKDVREVVERARRRLGESGQGTILFLDEVHRFNKSQQDVLLPWVEEGLLTLIGATTENPYFEVNAPLLSRSSLFRLEPLDAAATRELIERGLIHESAGAAEDAIAHLVDRSDGDARVALNGVEVAVALASARDDKPVRVTLADAEAALNARALRYERDEHYDIISAFIKSIRGSDPDAGLYWLARMLEAGEDARFIARRLVILASEDVGMADSMGIVVADSAARAVEFVGLPEAQLNLAHAVIYLATAPKSNRVIDALGRARGDVRDRPTGTVPVHLRDASYRSARKLGTAWATSILTTTPGVGFPRSTVHRRSPGASTTSRRNTARNGRSASGCDKARGVMRMTGEGVAAIGAVAIVVITAGLLYTMGSIIRTMRAMRRAVEDVHDETLPLLVDVHHGVVHTNQELKRVDGLIDRAESIGGTVDSTSKLAYKLVSNPAVKIMALSAGGARAFRQLRKRKG